MPLGSAALVTGGVISLTDAGVAVCSAAGGVSKALQEWQLVVPGALMAEHFGQVSIIIENPNRLN
jgi:hypothetical protein